MKQITFQQRIAGKYIIDQTSGCWLWAAAKFLSGYGCIRVEGKTLGAHRYTYENLVGLVPADKELDHLCRVRHCINPAHLEPVTKQENISRGEVGSNSAEKTHCPAGHELAGDNIYKYRGKRGCRECRRASQRAWKKRRKDNG